MGCYLNKSSQSEVPNLANKPWFVGLANKYVLKLKVSMDYFVAMDDIKSLQDLIKNV